LRRELDRLRDEEDISGLTLLDVGCGSGDLPELAGRWMTEKGVSGHAVGVDRDQIATRLGCDDGLGNVRCDAFRLPFADRAFDVVTAAKFAHHFEGIALRYLIAELARVARRRLVVIDIERHWLAYWGFRAWSLVGTRSRVVRYDGALSVLRGFTPAELAELCKAAPEMSWSVRRHAGFQLVLLGRRPSWGGPPHD
jgi:ubiquinone/menaquinone biosynthesis C-methylase UbiE